MYFFVMGNLSGRQQGIQAGHAALEYVDKYPDSITRDFIKNHKTFIVLDGGTSSTMLDRMAELEDLKIDYAEFREPDLNNSVSAIAFLVNEADYNDEDPYEVNAIKQYLKRFRLASN
jgi:hypothetical protein